MKKTLSILLFVAMGLTVFSQTIEDYSNPQRYEFLTFNRNNVYLERPIVAWDNWGCYRCVIGRFLQSHSHMNNNPLDTFYYYLDKFCMCSKHEASLSEPKMIYGVAIPIWDSVQHWDDTAAWILVKDTMFCGYIARGTLQHHIHPDQTYYYTQVNIYDTVHFKIGLNLWSDNLFKFKPTNYSFNCPDSIYHIIEVYFDQPCLMTDSFWVGEYVHFYETETTPPNDCYPRCGRMAIPDPSEVDYHGNNPYGPLFFARWLVEPQWVIAPGIVPPDVPYCFWGMHFPIIAPPPCFVIPPLKIRNVHNNCADVMWDNPVSSLYRRIELGPAGFTPGTGIIIDNFYGDSIHFQNLAPDLDYEVHVSSFCSTDSVYTEPTVAFFSTAMNCDMPQNVAVADITDSTAIIFWRMTSLSDYSELEYGPAGFSLGEGRLLSPIHSLGTGNCSRMMDSLQPGTAYTAYVRTWCDYSEMYSDWERVDFTTTSVNPNDTADHDTTSITTADRQRINLVPNPATNSVTVSAECEILSVEAYNVKGQRIVTAEGNGTTLKLDTSAWPNGTYTIAIRTVQGSVTRKLVIKK